MQVGVRNIYNVESIPFIQADALAAKKILDRLKLFDTSSNFTPTTSLEVTKVSSSYE